MNYSGNMPDWHQYNSPQSIGSEVSSVGQNVNHSPIFGSSISPRRLNGPNFSPEGLNKPQSDANYNPRNFQHSPNTINGPNVPPENPGMASAVQIPGCHGHYGAPSPRNTMIETTNTPLDARNPRSDALSEALGQRNHQISMNGPVGHLNCPTINGSIGIMGQRNTPTGIQAPIPGNIRQAPGSYVTCKGPCCNSDTNLSYQSWEKFGPYPPNVPYRETGYPVDSRRFGREFENRESLGTGTYNVDPRRNVPDYKYRKDSIIPRGYPQTPGVIQNYPVQNYNFPGDYQKYPGYPVKEYPRDGSITNSQNPAILKYQEQSVIVQQKYFTKQIQYQNGIIPKSMVSANMGGNIISRAPNPYFNPQLARDIPRDYSENTSLANRGIQSANSIQATYPKYQMYQQKIAMQRFSMENHLRELTRIPGYQSHPKYQECILRYRELLRLQQTVDYESTVQDAPRVITSQVNDEIPPINLQFDQNGRLINSNFAPAGFTNPQNPNNARNSKNLDSTVNQEIEPQNLRRSNQYKPQASFDNLRQGQDLSSMPQTQLSRENEERYSVAKEFNRDQYHTQKSQSDGLNVSNSENGQTTSLDHKNSKDFADKPELDVRQFLANWDESEDEDGVNADLPNVASNSSTSVVVEYGSTKSVSNSIEESENCSETQDWQSSDDRRMLENTQTEMKSSNSMDDQIHEYNLPAVKDTSKSLEEDLDISDPVKNSIPIATVIRSTGTDCENETSFGIMVNLEDCQDTHGSVKLPSQETETPNITKSQEASPMMNVDIAVKQESSVEEETITSIKEHIEAYKYETEVGICSSIEETMKNDDHSRSSLEKDSPRNTEHHYSSSEDLSESSGSDSTDSDTISSFIKSRETIKGTEIHVDAQELSISPKSNSEIVDSPDLQKQNSFVNEESHNPDDISLPDLPTSECTPISTTLNTPIHSDSEESSEPVIDLTIPTNPIEIIQNSPMLSFMHSPIKMEPYEHFDENDLTEKASHDGLEFKFQSGNSSDNDFERPIDISSHETERCNNPRNDEDTFDSDCIEIRSENGEQNIKSYTRKVETKDVLIGSVEDNESAIRDEFTFKEENVAVPVDANSTIHTDQRVWQSVTAEEHKNQMSDITKCQDDKSAMDELEHLSDAERRLSMTSEDDEDHSKDELACVSDAKQPHSSNQWRLQPVECEMRNIECKSDDSLTALNLVKDKSKINSDSIKMNDETTNLQAVRRESVCFSPRSDERMDFQDSSQDQCESSMDSQDTYTSSEHTELYSSSGEEDQVYVKPTENQSNSSSSLNIPLIPGEDFEEPKMPVLPMEGNCLTKIIKNTSPITDLDVLGSDDDKLDKMDDIWMEVGGVDTVGKVIDMNTDGLPDPGESSNRETSSGSKNNLCKLPKGEWKRVKDSVKPKDDNKPIVKLSDDGAAREINRTDTENSQPTRSSNSDEAQKEVETIEKNFENSIISPKLSITSKITSNRSFREGGNSHHDIGSENSATVMMKCQEKTNHINDIATKLLENARLFEPELRKIEVLKSETNCNDNSRDSSKTRIKLLKAFRKVKNRIVVAKPAIELTNSMDREESDIALPIGITEESTKINEIFEADDKITKNQNTDTETIINVLQKSHIFTEEVNINVESNRPHTPSTDIVIPEEKYRMSKDSEESLENENTSRKNHCIVNIADSVEVRDDISGISHKTLNSEVVNIFEEDITECAINSKKSLNDFDSLQTLQEAGCKINYSRSPSKTEDVDTDGTTEIGSEMSQGELNFTETKNNCSHSSQSAVTEDNALYSQSTKKNVEVLEITNAEKHSVAGKNGECNSNPTCTNSTEECILDEETNPKENRQSTTTTDYEKSETYSRNPEEINDPTVFDQNSGEITDVIQENCENFTDILKMNTEEMNLHVSESGGNTEVNDKTIDEIINSEISCSEQNVQTNAIDASMINEEESVKLMNNCNDSPKTHLSNDVPKEKTSIQNLDDSLSHINNGSQETTVTPSKISTDQTSLCDELERVDKLITTKEMEETDQTTVDDCLMNYQKSIKGLDATSGFHKPLGLIREDPKNSAKSLICNKSPEENSSKQFVKPDCLENSDLNDINLLSGTDTSLRTVGITSEPFGLHDSFDCDFNNFDVAPNINSTTDHDESSSWKYSKACARFEDCERYKNPDSFIDPVSTSFETLDNLNTVPIYTTKDGKITYSPNPRFTYRALIVEAREREGYPAMRELYYANSRAQESSHYSKNPSMLRRRKNSEGYSYSRSYSKRKYEPKEHGESSTKNASEPWNRNGSNYSKYHHQTRVRNSYHSAHHNADAEKKITAEKIVQEKLFNNYKIDKGASIFNEYDSMRNGVLNNYSRNNTIQYRQSREQSALDSAWSRHKQDFKYDHRNISEITSSRPDLDETFYGTKNKILENATTAETYLPDSRISDQSVGCSSTEKLTQISDKIEHTSRYTENILPTKSEPSTSDDTHCVEKQVISLNQEELKSTHSKTEDNHLNDGETRKFSNIEAAQDPNIKFGLFASEWEDSSESLVKQQKNLPLMDIPSKPFLNEIEAKCGKGIKVPALYDDIDVCEIVASNINGNNSHDVGSSDADCVTPTTTSEKSPQKKERFNEADCEELKLNIEENVLAINNAEDKDTSRSVPVQLIDTDKSCDQSKITETHEPEITKAEMVYENGSASGLNVETENSRDNKSNEPINCTDDQLHLNSVGNCTMEVKDINDENLSKKETSNDKQAELENSKPIDEIPINPIALESSNETSHNFEIPCDLKTSRDPEDAQKIEKEELKIENKKCEMENRNKTSVKNLQIKCKEDLSLGSTFERENVSKPQSQYKNYIAYSPSSEGPEDVNGIPKLVIKKTESLNCKNVFPGQPLKLSHGSSIGKVTDKDEQNSKGSVHPKIPKILIRNVKSRPSTPSIDEIIKKKVFSVSTKEENRVPKVKIRFEEKRPNSPATSSGENASKSETTESKIPKMKIKLEDRQPKIFIENMNMEPSQEKVNVPKIVPKMKIKKLKGTLSQVVDAQVLPVSIPRMFIYTELENEKQTSLTVTAEKGVDESDESLKLVIAKSISSEQKTIENTDCKKVPKLKIKRQSSGCSVELTRKRHNVDPVQSELKKTKKSLKPIDSNDRKQSNRSSISSERLDSLKKDTFSVKPSYELAGSSENAEYTTTAPRSQSTVKIKSDQKNSVAENLVSGTPEEIPKVIIKRASPSAEFKCELSKGRSDAIIRNKKWQPEVKLQRSWVLDCMAKDLNLDGLRLKLATPGTILKKNWIKRKSEVEERCVNSDNSTTNQRTKKLFRSKSTSDLVLAHGNIGTPDNDEIKRLDETNLTDLPRKLTTRKRRKSDLGGTFTDYSKHFQCKKKLKFINDPSNMQPISKQTLNCPDYSVNSLNIQSMEGRDTVVGKLRQVDDLNTSLKNLHDSKSINKAVDHMEISKRSADKTLDENMNSQSQISISKINQYNNSLTNNDTLHRSLVDADLNSPTLSGLTSTTISLDFKCECFENTDQINDILTNNLDVNETQKVNDWSIPSIERIEKSKDQREVNAAIANNLGPISRLYGKLELDIKDSSDDNVNKKADSTHRVSKNLISDITVAKQENDPTRNENVLNMPINDNSNSTNLDVEDVQDPKVDGDPNNSSSKTIATKDNSVLTHENCEESQLIVEILSDPPVFDGTEIEVESGLITSKDNDMCLYHEDAIPTQFELELEITDNVMSDTSEVPTPQNDYCPQEFSTCDKLDESNYKSNSIFKNSDDVVNLDNSKSEVSLPEKSGTNFFHVCATTYQEEPSAHTDERATVLATDSDERKSKSTAYVENAAGLCGNVKESFSQTDLLIKEVLAAKETLRKCLTRSKNESRFKPKARPKTAAEKKQGSGFDLSMISTGKDRSKPMNQIVDSANRSEKHVQNQTKTEFQVNTLKSERKHSKGNRNSSKQRKYSSLPTIVQKYTNLATMEGYNLIPQHSSMNSEESVAFTEDEKTISLKNSKHLIKNSFFSDTRRKTPELINSKDSKCRSKSSKQDGDSKCVGKSKSTLSNSMERESSVNLDHCKGKSISDAVSHKYKSLKPLSDQNVKSMTDRTKFQLYKIPKLTKSAHFETERSSEGLQETHSKEVRMPILEPQIDINHDLEVVEFSVGRDTSRSPPVITNQEIVPGHAITTSISRNDQCQPSSNKEKEVLLGQMAMPEEKEVPKAIPSYSKETTVADIVNDMAYHEKATIRHRRYCTLCERWFPTVARYRRHLSGYQHRHTELTQRRTIHTLFTLFTGRPCPRLKPPSVVRIDCEPGELTPLQIAVEGVTKESNKVDGNIRTSTSEDK